MPRKSSVVLLPSMGEKSCCFCGTKEVNELDYGKMHEYDGIVTHYYCLLFSSNMQQQGLDDEGILGFLPEDIHKELKRGKRLICSYCKKSGATLGCCNTKCKKIFHFPCGLRAGSLHQFFGEFRSYCIHHRPKQIIEERILKELSQCDRKICYICYDEVNPQDNLGTIWAPCCKKNAWFHRTCVQQLAISAGYFFKCPLCNNKTEFQRAMLDHGIFIPSQDASWELVPNAFQELLYRHNRCDAENCVCPKGREYTSTNAKWELTLCRTCGSQGIHMACGNLKWGHPLWECSECTSILNKTLTSGETSGLSDGSLSDRESRFENNLSDEENSSDSEISVGGYPETCTEIPSSNVEPQSSSFFPGTTSVDEKSPEKQRRDDTSNNVSSKSPRNITDNQETRDHRENNEELAPLTKKPKISLEQEVNKDDSDDDVIVVSGPSRKEPHRALEDTWVLGNSGKSPVTNEDTKPQLNELELQLKSNNVTQEVLNVKEKISTSFTGSVMSPQLQFPMRRIEKPVPIEIDLSDSETAPTTSSSTAANSQTSTNPMPRVPELNIQITNVTSLAPEAFAKVPESHDRPMNAKKAKQVPVTEKPKNVTAQPLYQRLEIIRLEAQPAADNLPTPVIYGITIPGTNTTVPLIITTAEAPQSSPSPSSNSNHPVPPSLSTLVGPKSRKAAILAAAALNNSLIQNNATSAVELPKLPAPTVRTNEISSITSPKLTPPTIQSNEKSPTVTLNLTAPTVQNSKRPIVITPKLTEPTVQSQERPIVIAPQLPVSTIQGDERSSVLAQRLTVPTVRNKDGSIVIAPQLTVPTVQGNERLPTSAPKITTSTIPINEQSAVLSPILTAPQIQNNQRLIAAPPKLSMPTIQNNQRSNIITVTIECNDELTVGEALMGPKIRSNNRWPLLAPKPTPSTIQNNEKSNPLIHEPATPKLSYSLPLEAVVNDQILKSRAGRKFDTKKNISCDKSPSKKNTPLESTSVHKNQDPTNGIHSTPASEVSAASSKNISSNGFISSRKIALLTPKTPSSSSLNIPPIISNSFAVSKLSYPAFPVGKPSEVQNGHSPRISAGDNLNRIPSCNGIQRIFDTPRKNSNSSDSNPTGSGTNSKPQQIPTTPLSKDSHTEDNKSLDSSKNCDGDAGTNPAVQPKRDVATNIKFNGTIGSNTHRNIGETKNGNNVSKKSGAENEFRNDSQYDAEKNETTECSITTDRGDSADRIGLINKMINLRDLKFTVCGSNIVKMTVYDTYCVNMKIENGKKRKFASCKNYEVSKKKNSDLLVEGEKNYSLSYGCDILRNADDHKGFPGSLTSSCAFDIDDNSEKEAVSKSSDNLQSNAVTKVLEVLPSDSTREIVNSRSQDELKENLDPVPSSTNIRTTSPIERKSKTRLRNNPVNTMQLLNERESQEKIIDEKTKSSPRKIGNQDQSLGTSKISYNEWKESSCGVARNLVASNDEGANDSRCENVSSECNTRLTRVNDIEEIPEHIESAPKRPKYEKYEDCNNEILPVNNPRIDNLPFGHLGIAEKVRNRKIPRVNNVCKNEKLHSNDASKNGKKSRRTGESESDNSVCCKVSIDLAKIRIVLANNIQFFEEIAYSKFHKFPRKNKRTKFEHRSLFKTFRSFDNLTIDDDRSSSIQTASMDQIRRWKSDESLLSYSKFEETFDRCNGISHGENTRRGHKRKTRSFEKHDCVR